MAFVPRVEIMIDCPDPVALAPFWAAALHTEIAGGEGDPYVELAAGPGQPIVCLQRVPEPKAGKTRIHLDLYVPAAEAPAEVARLVALGAEELGEPVRRSDGAFSFQIVADPAGTELCICAEQE